MYSMDSFQPCARQMLTELYVLLQRTPTVFASTRLVQMMALNMFSIHNLRERNASGAGNGKCALHSAICFVLCLVSLMTAPNGPFLSWS